MSIAGSLVNPRGLRHWLPDQEELTTLRSMMERYCPTPPRNGLYRKEFVANREAGLGYLQGTSGHPGRTPEGSLVTATTLIAVGQQVHSNAFNPIGWTGIQRMNETLEAAGSPVNLLDATTESGPWGLAGDDYVFFGGWDPATNRSVATTIKQLNQTPDLMPLRELGRWVDSAIESDLTIWAWIS